MSDTKDNTRPMTADKFWATDQQPDINPFAEPFEFAEAYADYRLRFEQGKQPEALDPFEGAPEWAEWRAADEGGGEWWHECKPSRAGLIATFDNDGRLMKCPDRRLTYSDWERSPVKRKR